MVKSHVACSPDLVWTLINKKQNACIRRSRHTTREEHHRSKFFSAEKNNLYSKHSVKFSGECSSGGAVDAMRVCAS